MYRVVILVALLAAMACNAQEQGSDVGVADESAAAELLEDGQAAVQQAAADTKASAQQTTVEAGTGLDNPLAAPDDEAASENPAK